MKQWCIDDLNSNSCQWWLVVMKRKQGWGIIGLKINQGSWNSDLNFLEENWNSFSDVYGENYAAFQVEWEWSQAAIYIANGKGSMGIACAWMMRASMHGPVQAHGGPKSNGNCKLKSFWSEMDVQMWGNWSVHEVFKWFLKMHMNLLLFETTSYQNETWPCG